MQKSSAAGGFTFTPAFVDKIIEFPHIIGLMLGYDLLTPLHSEWMHYCWDIPGGENRAMQASRNTYKTTSVTSAGFVYRKMLYPDSVDALIRETHTVACETLKSIVEQFKHPAIRELFKYVHGRSPEVIKYPEGSVTFNFKKSITKEGSITAAGITSLKTGSHFDFMLLDDIVTLESRLSRAVRERCHQGVLEIFSNIIRHNGSICFLGTPWHPEDSWNLSCVPYIKKFDVSAAIEHGIMTSAYVEKRKATTPASLFAANYLLVHMSDESSLFRNPKYDYWKFGYKQNYRAIMHLDAKYAGTDTLAVTIGCFLPDGFIQVAGFCWTEHVDEHKKDIKELYKRYRCELLIAENNSDRGYVLKEFGRTDEFGDACNVKDYHEQMNKHKKIITYGKPYFGRCIFDNDMLAAAGRKCGDEITPSQRYMITLMDYCEGQAPDDAADSFSSLMRYFNETSITGVSADVELLWSSGVGKI